LNRLPAWPVVPAGPGAPVSPALNIRRFQTVPCAGQFPAVKKFPAGGSMAKGRIEIDRELCKGCYLCVRACPVQALEADSRANSQGTCPALNARPGDCTGCANCYEVCPDVAITVYREAKAS
jgi:2-oxoglutarate ferredoxin oxidoreductase subunit delta